MTDRSKGRDHPESVPQVLHVREGRAMDSQFIPVKRCYQSGNRDKSTVKKQIPGVRATGEGSDVLGEQSVIYMDRWWVILPPVLQLSHTHRV